MALGSFLAALGVMLGAFGAHSLPNMVAADQLTKSLDNWKTGAHYHLIHAVALVIVGLIWAHVSSGFAKTVAALFTFGILIFGGTLYAMALGAPRFLGAITPLGGLSFILGWVVLAVAALKSA